MLRLIADSGGEKLLGVPIIGDGATELIHRGQTALQADMPVETFVENILNFRTIA
ncbi:MAG: NAD(P) transhydrogenase [Halioglobus sp.]|jgi:NAD(P) transhydrogenase